MLPVALWSLRPPPGVPASSMGDRPLYTPQYKHMIYIYIHIYIYIYSACSYLFLRTACLNLISSILLCVLLNCRTTYIMHYIKRYCVLSCLTTVPTFATKLFVFVF